MPFKKGESGNPNGRPPRNRALTQILESAGNTKIEYDGKQSERKKVLAALLWEIATTGKAVLPGGGKLDVAPQDWFGVVKFLYSHIDGAPKAELDITTGNEPFSLEVKAVEYRNFIPAPIEDGSIPNSDTSGES